MQNRMIEETKTAQILVRVRRSLKALAGKTATDDQRSLSSLFEKLLTDYFRGKGHISEKPAKRR